MPLTLDWCRRKCVSPRALCLAAFACRHCASEALFSTVSRIECVCPPFPPPKPRPRRPQCRARAPPPAPHTALVDLRRVWGGCGPRRALCAAVGPATAAHGPVPHLHAAVRRNSAWKRCRETRSFPTANRSLSRVCYVCGAFDFCVYFAAFQNLFSPPKRMADEDFAAGEYRDGRAGTWVRPALCTLCLHCASTPCFLPSSLPLSLPLCVCVRVSVD